MPESRTPALLWPLELPPVEFGALDTATPWREPLHAVSEPVLLRFEVRTLTAPNGQQVVARVPVFGPSPFRRKRLKRRYRGRRLY